MQWLKTVPIAHRGLHDEQSPENSLEAFSKAMRKGYAIELDVHLSSDGVLLVFHDYSLFRMTGVAGDIRRVDSNFTRSLELLGSASKIPTLQEVLTLVNGAVPILVEIKNETKVGELESALAHQLKSYNGAVAVQSFNPFSLAWFAKNAPEYIRGQLSGSFSDTTLPGYKKFLLGNLLLNFLSKPHFIAYEAAVLPKTLFKLRRNKPLLGWTVRSEDEQQRALQYCDNVIFEHITPEV